MLSDPRLPVPGSRLYRIGCASWSIPRQVANRFPGDESHLQRYARRFDAVEINSSFHRPHKPAVYERWAAATPEHFRFAVKLPKEITHVRKLVEPDEALEQFFTEVAGLGPKLGPLLVQLPPSLAFDADVALDFFAALLQRFDGDVVCEPRHATWFDAESDGLLAAYRVARVAADPACVPDASRPGGWPGLAYYRLHGSPRTYWSSYEESFLRDLATSLASSAAPTWCIFDNTASGAAAGNALDLLERHWGAEDSKSQNGVDSN